MKKFGYLLLIGLMLLSFAACAKAQETTAVGDAQIDVDLTQLSSTMVYSEVYNMMTEPKDYVGKTVRMNGQYTLFYATDADGQPVPEQVYYACVIADATACCQQGMEFVLADGMEYPEETGAEITVTGEFQTYLEGQQMYCHLIDAVVEEN